MKEIELTKEHKAKLVEMCKTLFPEYPFITFEEEAIMGAGWGFKFNNICFSKKSSDIYDIEINIHWYEFVMTKLAPKLANNYPIVQPLNPVYDASCFLSELMMRQQWYSNYHHIDYIYEEFKKVTNEK